jgi:thiol-disulfide isomerase/thioredoxin
MQELLVGDRAPKLVLAEFLKGEPVFELVSGNIYVIEFWASWCGPCRAGIPLLSELQDELPQVTVIGVSIERGAAAVRTFVAEMGDQIRYRIAMDQSFPNSADETESWMVRHWLHASYKSGVPTSFVVDASGKIAWLGHLMELKAPLTKIVNGVWDLAAAAQAHKESFSKDRVRFHFQPKILMAYSDNDNATAVAEIDNAIAAEPALEEVFCTLKLCALMKDSELMAAAKNYATHLIDLHHEDMQSLLMLSMMLFEPNKMEARGGGFERNAVFLDLALQAMVRI